MRGWRPDLAALAPLSRLRARLRSIGPLDDAHEIIESETTFLSDQESFGKAIHKVLGRTEARLQLPPDFAQVLGRPFAPLHEDFGDKPLPPLLSTLSSAGFADVSRERDGEHLLAVEHLHLLREVRFVGLHDVSRRKHLRVKGGRMIFEKPEA